jgi:predicted cation transporter
MLRPTSIILEAIALFGVMLAVPLGAFIRRISQSNDLSSSLLVGIPLKATLSVIAVVLGLLAWILTPILPLLVLIVAAKLLPIGGKAKTGFLIIGCLSIGLGAALSTGDLPISQIAALKLLGSPYQTTISGMLGP